MTGNYGRPRSALAADLDTWWIQSAACRGMDTNLFYADRGDTVTVRSAKSVCMSCPVRTDCLEYALATADNIGIWGGLTPRARARLRRQARHHSST